MPSLTDIRAERERRAAERERNRVLKDVDGIRRRCKSLHQFIREAWHVLEPNTPFVDGWHIKFLCAHLEAITWGKFLAMGLENRLLINIPPGSAKSLIVSCFWPAWEWGPCGFPSLRYLTTSYSEDYAKRDARRTRDLIQSEWYQAAWGGEVQLVRSGESSFANSQTGFRQAVPFIRLTGGRGDRVICLPADEVVWCERSKIAIGKIVEKNLSVRVWSMNHATGRAELKPVCGWIKNPASELLEVLLSDGAAILCTPSHRLWTRRGWVEARLLSASDRLPRLSVFDSPNQSGAYSVAQRKRSLRILGVEYLQRLIGGYFSPGGISAARSIVGLSIGGSKFVPGFASSDLLDCSALHSVALSQNVSYFRAFGNLDRLLSRKDGAGSLLVKRERPVSLGIFDVLRASAVMQVIKSAVGGLAVLVANLFPLGWRPDERKHESLVNPHDARDSVLAGVEAGIPSLARRRLKNLLSYLPVSLSAYFDRPRFISYAAKIANAVTPFVSRDRKPTLIRKAGHVDTTYCLTVADNHNFYAGSGNGMLVANCDDPHSTEMAESEADRMATTRIFRESVPLRLNDPVKSAIVVIMQRLHARDVSGVIEDLKLPYIKIMLPMEFEPDRRCVTPIDEDPRTYDGELLWPERFTRASIDRDKVPLGSYGIASQLQQRPSARAGGLFKRAWFEGKIISAAPADVMQEVRHWDLAGTKKSTAARTAGVKIAKTRDGRFIVTNVKKEQEEGAAVRRIIRLTAETDGKQVAISLPQDPGQAGKVQAQDYVSMLAGWVVKAEPETGDKEFRAKPFAAQCEAGNVYIVAGEWNEGYIDELCDFPTGKFKDQVDASSGAFGYLVGNPSLYDASQSWAGKPPR